MLCLFKEDQTLRWADTNPARRGPATGRLRDGEPSVPLTLDGVVKFMVGGKEERVLIDYDRGPVLLLMDGTTGFMAELSCLWKAKSALKIPHKSWTEMTSSEREVLARQAAKTNQARKDLKGAAFWNGAADRDLEDAPELEDSASERQAMKDRCARELAKPTARWMPISLDHVTNNHEKKAKGMIYGLEFPWTEASLVEFGPKWLTEAFRAAGTLDQRNRVTSISVEKKIKITAGNNAGKFLFEVCYARKLAHLHTKLFAKVPFAMTPATKTDRLSSSVYKQPMDLCEINTYRLFEATLPTKTPKYYFGDISNETSNFILITERIPFAEIRGPKTALAQFDIEGPYDKCMDFQLRGPAKEYYTLLMRVTGRIAGAHMAGRVGSQEHVSENLTRPRASADNPLAWGFNPFGVSGEAVESYRRKLDAGVRFFSDTAKVVFPKYVVDEAFHNKFMDTLLTWNAYSAEIEYFKILNPDYVALGHNNLNIDNAYFWRDQNGELDCGVIDWGGFGVCNLGHKIYWMLNCSDFEHIQSNLDDYIYAFVAEYHAFGGPMLDPKLVKQHIILTAVSNLSQMIQAIPNSLKMCPAKEWETIRDRRDPRIFGNVDGKSTLRSTIRQVDNGLRILEEMQGDRALDGWIQSVWREQFKQQPKSRAVTHGEQDAPAGPPEPAPQGELEHTARDRCAAELAKPVAVWAPISLEQVTSGHARRAPGLIYGLEFPWTEASLVEFGAKWLTDAFRTAGTLDKNNRVTRIIPEKKIKITAGNNAGKFLFEVNYAVNEPHLHTQLFAKVPFPLTPATKTDRLSSSVYKQPMDLCEINTYRLFESSLPTKTPKYYYGDISNETSNFIMITERIPYAEIGGKKDKLEPYEIEGPYDKCMDFQLGDASAVREHYTIVMRTMGRIAGAHKAERIGSEECIRANLSRPRGGPDNPGAFGFSPDGSSGEAPASYGRKLDTALRFFRTARAVLPEYATQEAFQEKIKDTLLTWNAYQGEIEYFKILNDDYVALGHNNLNIDNAYFWRDEAGELDCGVIDWGAFGVSNLGHKIYWILNCSDFENIEKNLDVYIETFVAEYHACGGPALDPGLVKIHIILTALGNLSQMMQAVPNCIKMCPAKEWETIEDRHDPRISGNIDGKSTLRSTLRQLDNGLRMIEEIQGDKVLASWIQDKWVGEFKQEPKGRGAIHGT